MNDADIERLLAKPPVTIEITGCPCVLCSAIRARRAVAKFAALVRAEVDRAGIKTGWIYSGSYGRPARWDQMDPTETVEFTDGARVAVPTDLTIPIPPDVYLNGFSLGAIPSGGLAVWNNALPAPQEYSFGDISQAVRDGVLNAERDRDPKIAAAVQRAIGRLFAVDTPSPVADTAKPPLPARALRFSR